MTEAQAETETLERTNMLWPPSLKEKVREKVGGRGITEFTIGAVEQRLVNEDRVRDLEKEVGELRYLSQLLADRVAMGGDHEDRNHLLMEVELPSWMKTDGWPEDMKGLVPIAPPKVTKVYSEEELSKPAHVVAAETKPKLIHIADRAAGDTTPLCRHEYAGHEGPCEPGEPFPGASEPSLVSTDVRDYADDRVIDEVLAQTEEAKEVFAQAGDDLFSRIQAKAAEKGIDVSGAGLVPASKIPRPEQHHNHAWERTDGILCCECGAWIDDSDPKYPNGIVREAGWGQDVPTEPAPALEVPTRGPTPVGYPPMPVTAPAYARPPLNIDDIEVDF